MSCPATARSWSSGSATSWATGGWSSTPPTARRSTRPGRWRSTRGCASATASTSGGQAIASDDGIVIRIPDTDAEPPGGEVVAFEPDEIDDLVTQEVGGSALFASRFRECAARALLLPRRDPGRRSPAVAAAPAQRGAARGRRQVPVVPDRARGGPRVPAGRLRPARPGRPDAQASSAARSASTTSTRRAVARIARSLLFGYVAQFVYEGDSPIAERRAAALALDQGLLAELLGRAELRELLDPEVLAEVEAELQRAEPERRARDAEGVADLLRLLGPLTTDEVAPAASTAPTSPTGCARSRSPAGPWSCGWPARSAGRPSRTSAGCATASGVPVPPGMPDAFTEPVEDPLARPGRAATPAPTGRSPSTTSPAGSGSARPWSATPCSGWAAQGRVLEGEFRPAGSGAEWCDAEVLRLLRRRSLARLRQEVEPVEPAALGRFLLAWQHVGRPARGRPRGVDGRADVVDQLAGCAGAGVGLESLVLPTRVADYEPALLDELTAAGEVHWFGHGTLPGADGWVSLHLADQAPLTAAARAAIPPSSASCTRRCSTHSRRVGRGSSASSRPPPAAPTRCSPTPSGSWSGPAASPTTPWPRCVRSPARVPPPTAPAVRRARARPVRAGIRPAPGRRRPRPLGPASRARPRPHPPRPRDRRADARAARGGDPRRGDVGARHRRLRRRLQGAVGVRGLRPLPTWLLRRGPRRRPVRHRRRHRPAADLHRPGRRRRPSRRR